MRKKTIAPLFRGSARLNLWQQCYDEWIQTVHERTGSTATVSSYRCETRRFFIHQAIPPDMYAREDVTRFIRRQVRRRTGHMETPSPATQNRRLATLRSFYDFAAGYGIGPDNEPILTKASPCTGIRSVHAGHKPRGLTEQELQRLFAVIPTDTLKGLRDRALMLFYFWSARRRSEILRLTWGDIYEVVFVGGGVQRTGHMYRYSSKGHSRDIFTAELRDEAWESLIVYLKASGRYGKMQPESPLFITSYWTHRETALHPCYVNVIIQEYAEKAGLHTGGRKITIHWLRHTRAQLQRKYDQSGDALEEIRRLLGHSSLNTTMIYLRGGEQQIDRGASRIAQSIGRL